MQPQPEWKYIFFETAKKLTFLLFIVLGGISFSVILFAISENGFDLLQHFRHSRIESFLVVLPLLWLASHTLFLAVSVFSVLNTGRAYKYSMGKWMMVSAALSMTIGTLFFITGGAKWLEKKFETHIESYESILEKKTRIWSQPELGTLSGEIVKIQNNTLLLKDWTNKVWEISISESFVAPAVQLEKGIQIKMNGRKTGAYYFKADKVRPWGGMPGKCMDPVKK
ncbi:MAG: hypothetical protein IPL63_00285 [Saprospiraceae bacterium]|nr:hypothetical protein [Saprospiraceae bacterium]